MQEAFRFAFHHDRYCSYYYNMYAYYGICMHNMGYDDKKNVYSVLSDIS